MKNKEYKVYKIIFIILIIIAIIVISLIAKKYFDRNKYENKNKEIVQLFENLDENDNLKDMELDGHKIIGIINIPKINLEYPILEETTKETMNKSISRFWGGEINTYGNVCLAGHNNKDGTMFGKNKYLELGDIIKLTDLNKNVLDYKIYDIFNTDPNDVNILKTNDENQREITLITCTNGRANRLIIKAKEI